MAAIRRTDERSAIKSTVATAARMSAAIAHAIGQRRKFLVGKRHRAGQPHADASVRVEAELVHAVSNRRGGACAGLQRGIVEHRLHQHEAPQRARIGSLATEQSLPRERRLAPAGENLERGGEARQRRRELARPRRVGLHALERL